MAVPYHTHTFEIPTASKEETGEVSISDKVVVPSSLGTAAVADVSDFATAAQGELASSALQPANGQTAFQTVADGEAAIVASEVNDIRLNGYYAAGDGGGAHLTDIDNGTSPLAYSGGATSRAWYIVGPTIHCKTFGIVGDGVTDDTEALAKLIAYANAKGGHFLFGGCKVANNGTHIITGKGIWLDSEGSGEILHADPEEPAFIVGSDDVRAERVKITGFRFEMTGENVDLFTPDEDSAFVGAKKIEVASAICIRQATHVRVMNCHSDNFLRLVALKGKVGSGSEFLWSYDVEVHGCVTYGATYLMTADLVDGFAFTNNGMIGWQRVWADSVSELKRPHLLYVIDRSVPPARNIRIDNCWTDGLEYGGALIFRGAENVSLTNCTVDGEKITMCDCVEGLSISNINYRATITDQDFPAGLDIRACKNFVINGVHMDLLNAYRPRAIRLISLATSSAYGDLLTGDNVRGHHGLISNIHILSQADNDTRRYSIEVRGQEDVHFRDIIINHEGVINPTLIKVGADENVVEFISENVSFDQITIRTDGVSSNYNRAFVIDAETENISVNLNQKDLSYTFDESNTIIDSGGIAVGNRVLFDGAEFGTFTPTATFATMNGFVPAYSPGNNQGFWRKRGKWVEVWGKLQFDANDYSASPPSGQFRIGGLPYAASSNTANWPGTISDLRNMDLGSTIRTVALHIPSGQTYALIRGVGDNDAGGYLSDAAFTSAETGYVVLFSATYKVG